MNKKSEQWNRVSDIFKKIDDKENSLAADNVFIAWPVILNEIERYKKEHSGEIKILDYGCGTGKLCGELDKNKSTIITGIDFSSDMIDIAIKSSSKEIEYLVGDINDLKRLDKKFNIIVSVMVLQFVENLNEYAMSFNNLLEKSGMVILAVFNQAFIKECLLQKTLFKEEGNKIYLMPKKDVKIETNLRNELEYRDMFESKNFTFKNSFYPEFTKEFVNKYEWKYPANFSEFMIMVFEKNEK